MLHTFAVIKIVETQFVKIVWFVVVMAITSVQVVKKTPLGKNVSLEIRKFTTCIHQETGNFSKIFTSTLAWR
jgi:hypothetical protein